MQPVISTSSLPPSAEINPPSTPRRVVVLTLASPRGSLIEAPYAPEKPRQVERAGTVQRAASPILDELRIGNGSPQSLLTACSDDEGDGIVQFVPKPDKHLTCSPPPCVEPIRRSNQSVSGAREPSPHATYGELRSLSEINETYGAYFFQDNQIDAVQGEAYASRPFDLSDAQIVFLKENQSGRDVVLSEVDIVDGTLDALVSTIEDRRLEKLLLHRCPKVSELGFLTDYRYLQWLRISTCPNFNPECFLVSPNKAWPRLTYLDFQDSPVTDSTILALPELRSLTHIDVSYTQVTFSGILDLCARQQSLKSIAIKGLQLTKENIHILSKQRRDIKFIYEEQERPVLFDAPEVEVEFQSAEHFAILQGFIIEETQGQVNYWTKLEELALFRGPIEGFWKAYLKALKIDHLVAEENPLSSYRGWYVAETLIQNYLKRNLPNIFFKLIPLVRKTAKEFTVRTRVRDLDERDKERNKKEIRRRCFEHLASLNLCRSQLARIKELDLSAIGIDEIPLCFCNLSWAHLEKLSLKGNKNIIRIPPCYLDGKNRTIHPFSKFSNLRELNLSYLGLTSESVVGLLSFVPFPTHVHSLGREEVKENEEITDEMRVRREKDLNERRVAVLPRLGKLNLAGNKLQFFEDVGITEEHGAEMTKEEKRQHAKNLLLKEEISEAFIKTMDREGFFPKRLEVDLSNNPLARLSQMTLDEFGKSKIQTTLYLKEVKLGTHPLPSFPDNVKPIFDRTSEEDEKADV